MENSNFLYDDPIIVLNGLVTDRNEYPLEKKIELLRKKKKISKKEININNGRNHIKNNQNSKNKYNLRFKKENISEESNSEIMSFIDLDKSSDLKKDKNKNKSLNKNLTSYEDFFSSQKYKINTQKKNKSENKRIKKKEQNEKEEIKNIKSESLKKNILNNFTFGANNNINKNRYQEDNDNDNEFSIFSQEYNNSISKGDNNNYNEFSIFSQEDEKIKYKTVKKCLANEEIKSTLKKNNCVCVPLYKISELKSIIEQKSTTFKLIKELENKEKEEKIDVIISDQNQEKDLVKELNEILSRKASLEKYKLLQNLKPEYNNILRYFPNDYCGINTYGFMSINSYLNDKDEIQFISPYFKDRTEQYKLKFRKYIINLSSFISNLNNKENYIYHIIIPKNNVNKIDINFNEEMDLNHFLEKLNCEYYFYKQDPGELLIVEPECIHLSYYKTKKKEQKKNYLIMFWNKLSINSFSDYMTLKNDCIYQKYKYFPISSMLLNLLNKKLKYISNDNIKTILEIYNEMDKYENINKYNNLIKENNIYFLKLFLNIDICGDCSQEIFNYYVITNLNEFDEDLNIQNEKCNNFHFICINCAYRKNYFSNSQSIIFYKYSKTELDSFISKITSYLNKNKEEEKIDIISINEEEIISECFNLNRRENDSINIKDLILKIKGPLNILDREYQDDNNFYSQKNIKVDKYLKYFQDDKLNINEDIDPLNLKNFINNINENDIYINLFDNENDYSKSNFNFTLKEFGNLNNNNNTINQNNNFFNNTFIFKESDSIRRDNHHDLLKKNSEFNNKNNFNQNSKTKSKKKKSTSVADLLKNGEF